MNTSNSSETPWPEETAACKWYTISIYILVTGLILVCIFGNSLSFYVWKKVGVKHGSSSCNILFMVLAVSDTLMNIVIFLDIALPFFIFYFSTGYNYYNDFIFAHMDKYMWPFARVANQVTKWITSLLTIHRYAVLHFPFSTKTHKLTSLKSTRWQVSMMIILSVLFNISSFFYFDIEVTNDGNKTYANIQRSSLYVNDIYNIIIYNDIYNITHFSIGAVLTVSILLLCIILTYKIIRLLAKAQAARASMVTGAPINKEREITVALVIVVSIFIICEMVICIHNIVIMVDPNRPNWCGTILYYIADIVMLAAVLNSSVNGFVYGSCSSQFRNELPMWLQKPCNCRCEQVEQTEQLPAQAVATITRSSTVTITESTQI